jgi:hypothetical protein
VAEIRNLNKSGCVTVRGGCWQTLPLEISILSRKELVDGDREAESWRELLGQLKRLGQSAGGEAGQQR